MAWRRRDHDDFTDEVRAHLEHEAAELRAAGMSAEDARAEALRRFGNATRARERVYDAHPLRWIEVLWQDVKFGVRLMRRSPAFTVAAAVVLSLGIGANTALFSIVNALFFKPLPVEKPEELFYLYYKNEAGQVIAWFGGNFDFFLNRTADFADYTGHSNQTVRVAVDNETEMVAAEMVLGNYFDLLGVKMALGRPITVQDDIASVTEYSIVISHEYWTRRFNRDAAIVGRKVRLESAEATIAGVAEAGFDGLNDPFMPTRVWVSGMQIYTIRYGRPPSMVGAVPLIGGPIGRMRPGVTIDQIRAAIQLATADWRADQLELIGRRATGANYEDWRRRTLATQFPVYAATETRMPFSPERQLIPPGMLAGMIAVVALVLLIAAANIAGLLLARGMTRVGEVAVRRALGANGGRVTRQLLTESVLLALGGGALGLAVAATLVGLFRAFTPSRFTIDVPVDLRVLLFAIAICVGAGILVGLAPALQAARVNVLEALGSGIVGARVVRARLRHWIVVPQIALSLVLLIVAAVHVRALLAVEGRELGYRTHGTTMLSIGRWEPRESWFTGRRTKEENARFQEEGARKVRQFNRTVLQRVAAVNGLESYALASYLPLAPRFGDAGEPLLTQDDFNRRLPSRAGGARMIVSNRFFETMGMRVLQGRTFDDRDGPYEAFGPRVAVVSDAVARALWPQANPLGQIFAFEPNPGQRFDWLQVIGVVNDIVPVLEEGGRPPLVFVPVQQQWMGSTNYLVVRGPGDQSALIRDVKAAVVGADAFAEVVSVRTLRQMVAEILYPRRIAAGVLTAAGTLGLVLACIGLYGVVSYSVAQRTREIGIRATLGAERRDIVMLVLRESAMVLAIGTVAGLGLALLALRLTAGLIPDVPRGDVLSFVVVPLTLALVVAAACLLPARRAARVDPAQVLRGL